MLLLFFSLRSFVRSKGPVTAATRDRQPHDSTRSVSRALPTPVYIYVPSLACLPCIPLSSVSFFPFGLFACFKRWRRGDSWSGEDMGATTIFESCSCSSTFSRVRAWSRVHPSWRPWPCLAVQKSQPKWPTLPTPFVRSFLRRAP